ncbi:MAG: quinolinate synthase NadA [Candidatus Thorarchaeota archaeon]
MDSDLSDLQKHIIELKKRRNALLLAHNYQPIEIQEIADFVGDSLQLARKSAEVSGYDMVVFSGVRFMAELAAVLARGVPVYIPAPDALCPLAAWLTPDKVRAKRSQYPDAPVVVYVNTTAETKAECDVICTSSNAAEVVESLGAETVLFGPDTNLAEYVRRQTGVNIVDIEPRGHCYVHRQFDLAHIMLARDEHPDAIVIVHPECPPEVQDAADIVGSTGRMVEIVAESDARKFIIATEIGLVEQLQKAHPDKVIVPAYEKAVCRQMKQNSLEKVLHVLRDLPEENLVTVSPELAERIREAIERMNRTHVTVSEGTAAATH